MIRLLRIKFNYSFIIEKNMQFLSLRVFLAFFSSHRSSRKLKMEENQCACRSVTRLQVLHDSPTRDCRRRKQACRAIVKRHEFAVDLAESIIIEIIRPRPMDAWYRHRRARHGIFGYLYWPMFIIYSPPLILLIFRVGV